MERPNLIIIGMKEGEELQLKGRKYINKIIDKKLPYLKKDMPMKVQITYRLPNKLGQKKSSPTM